jgi:N-acyl-D-aspartate/D-glutamate deacylase
MAHDVVIRGGTIVDGTGAPPFDGDVAIDGDRVTEVGDVGGTGSRELDAAGLLVTPGWVDIHTHYDGQATWDPWCTPSGWHGVTTVVMGNCGVGFAPARRDRHDWLIGLMEGVEDIPGSALSDGITWGWETFGEYLDCVDAVPRALDVAALVPHGAVRAYVMGERGARNEPATPDDIQRMAAIVRDGLAAGGVGFSSSRTVVHRAIDGEPVPGTFAAEDELLGIAAVVGEFAPAIFEVAPAGVVGEDLLAPERELGWMRRVAEQTGVTMTFLISQHDAAPDAWREAFRLCEEAQAAGVDLRPQVLGRPLNMLFGHATQYHPFANLPSYQELTALPLAERVARLREPETRARILSDAPPPDDPLAAVLTFPLDRIFPLGDPPDYEPPRERSIAALAAASGREPREMLYELMLTDDGRELFMNPVLNYSETDSEVTREMLLHPTSLLGGSDGGAHCGVICDASTPTTMLTHWARDRSRGDRLPLEWIVRKQTADTARAFGMTDRGELRPGQRADINLIDLDSLSVSRPEMTFDLPAGARRLVQRAQGYVSTLVAGEVVAQDGEDTGARPGRVMRAHRA